MLNTTTRTLYPRERLGTIVYEAVWAPWPVWRGAENLASTGIRFPDRPASSKSLYRLSYLGQLILYYVMLLYYIILYYIILYYIILYYIILYYIILYYIIYYIIVPLHVSPIAWRSSGRPNTQKSQTCKTHP